MEYINVRHKHPPQGCRRIAAGTINRDLAVARRILNLCARLWRDEGSTLTCLAEASLIQLLENKRARKPYLLDWDCMREKVTRCEQIRRLERCGHAVFLSP